MRPPTQPYSRQRCRPQAGMTLIEILIALTIFAIVTTMLVGGWINLQRSSVFAVQTLDARATVRDALGRISSELRDGQPTALPTAPPASTSMPALFTIAQPTEVEFYSVFNLAGADDEGSGTARRLTRIWLDTAGSTPQLDLYWQRDTNGNDIIDGADRTRLLASDVVNNSIPNSSVTPQAPYTAIFRYWYRDASGALSKADAIPGADLADTQIVAVQVRLIVDANLNRAPSPIDLTTTVRPRNASVDQ
jgi:prepilin-type N-terminal cleavage/methylation domain-containing protein